MKTYELDDETRMLLEGVFELAQRVVDLQIDDEAAQDLQNALITAADRFGITCTEIPANDEQPTQPLPNTKPKFTVIDGDLPHGFSRSPDDSKPN